LTCASSAPLSGSEPLLKNGQPVGYTLRTGYASAVSAESADEKRAMVLKAYVKGDLVQEKDGEKSKYSVLAMGKEEYEVKRCSKPLIDKDYERN